MINISELEKRIHKLLKVFRKRTKCMATFLLDKDGLIIDSLVIEELKGDKFTKKIINFYTKIEDLALNGTQLLDIEKNTEIVSIGEVNEFFNHGLMIMVRAIGELTYVAVFPTLLKISTIKNEFEKVVDELSIYFSGKGQFEHNIGNLYTLV